MRRIWPRQSARGTAARWCAWLANPAIRSQQNKSLVFRGGSEATRSGNSSAFDYGSEDGTAQDIQTVRSLGYGLDDKAIEAVRKWRFAPGTVQGTPVKARAQVEVNFQYGNKTDYRWSPGPIVFVAEDGFVPPEVTGGSMTAKLTETTDSSAWWNSPSMRTGR